MSPKHPYIQRKQAKRFIQDIENAIDQPQGNYLLFNAYGKNGIGKSTLFSELIRIFGTKFQCAKISYGINSPIKTISDLMAGFNEHVVGDPGGWDIDYFKELNEKYEQTCHKLASESNKGESFDSQKQTLESIKQFGKAALGSIFASSGTGALAASVGSPLLNTGIDSAFDIAGLLTKNKLTKNNLELQELVKKPIPKLAKAFIQTIIQKSQYKPILLFIDNYEKASSEVNTFIIKFILSNKELQNSPVRIIMASESSLKNNRYKGMYQQYSNPGLFHSENVQNALKTILTFSFCLSHIRKSSISI